jgi:hypothetical protein
MSAADTDWNGRPYPSYVTTATERALWNNNERDNAVIRAMQRRASRNPIRDFLWRRPWRSSSRPNLASLRDTWNWLAAAHDCSDPAVGCSCTGGFRFPRTAR